MFESTKPISKAQGAPVAGRFASRVAGRSAGRAIEPDARQNDLLVGSAEPAPKEIDGASGRGGDALRLIEWGELTARLNAARDLRLVLGRDANLNIEANGGSFADAAASYFRTKASCFRTKECLDIEKDRGKPDVNPVALEHSKGSPGMIQQHDGLHEAPHEKQVQIQGHAVNGDAREN